MKKQEILCGSFAEEADCRGICPYGEENVIR